MFHNVHFNCFPHPKCVNSACHLDFRLLTCKEMYYVRMSSSPSES